MKGDESLVNEEENRAALARVVGHLEAAAEELRRVTDIKREPKRPNLEEAWDRAQAEFEEVVGFVEPKAVKAFECLYPGFREPKFHAVGKALSEALPLFEDGVRLASSGRDVEGCVQRLNDHIKISLSPTLVELQRGVGEEVSDRSRAAALDLMGSEGPFNRNQMGTINNGRFLFDGDTRVMKPYFLLDQVSVFRGAIRFMLNLIQNTIESEKATASA